MNDPRLGVQPKINQRRRAVYGALRAIFGERQAAIGVAFRLWEREFANQPHFVVTRFVSRCSDTIGLSDTERISLTRRTFELLATPYEALERYPDELLAGVDEAERPPASSSSG